MFFWRLTRILTKDRISKQSNSYERTGLFNENIIHWMLNAFNSDFVDKVPHFWVGLLVVFTVWLDKARLLQPVSPHSNDLRRLNNKFTRSLYSVKSEPSLNTEIWLDYYLGVSSRLNGVRRRYGTFKYKFKLVETMLKQLSESSRHRRY